MMEIPRDVFAGWVIMLIDDEPDSLEVARYLLAYYGADVLMAENGADALKLIHEKHPRFVISDLSMPVMDGWKLIRVLKEDPATCELPVIALTAHAMVGDRERTLAAGFFDYMSKPFMVDTFIGDLVRIISNEPKLKELLPNV